MNQSVAEVVEQFKNELALRRYAISTRQTYGSCLALIASKIGTDPSIDNIKAYLLTIPNASYHKQLVATLHRYFELVLRRPLSLKDIPYPRQKEHLPEVLSEEEMESLVRVPKNLKHQAILCLLYGCGLRISEVLNLKIKDVDSKQMILRIMESKGQHRIVMIDDTILSLLRSYFKGHNPKEYLFNGQHGNQYTESSINQFLKYYAKKAKIRKRISAHTMRHSFATHLLEGGIDMAIIQKLLGHKNIKTTQGYARVSRRLISKVKNPVSQFLSL